MRTHINIFLAFIVLATLFINNLSAQISTYDKVEKTGVNSFNYPDKINNINDKLKKDPSVKIVFSDRDDNPVYADPYAQQRIGTQPMGAAYFVVNSKNDAYQVTTADFSLLGKPKAFFSFLMSAKYRFKDARNAPYVGWIPKTRLLEFDHSFLHSPNNKPLKYRIGINNTNRLFNTHRYFVNDTLKLFKDPFLKENTGNYVLLNQIVYPYKYDEAGKAVLVSTQPELRDSSSQVIGWIPADLISLVGQNQIARVSGEILASSANNDHDGLRLNGNDLYQNTLFYLADHPAKPIQNRNVNVVAPLNVWNHESNKLINVRGRDIFISEVHRFEEESKNVNLHLLFFEKDKNAVTNMLNGLQNIWMHLAELPDYNYTFSASCVSDKGNFHLPPTPLFDVWLDYVNQTTTQNKAEGRVKTSDLDGAIADILKHNKSTNFENNIFMVLGTNQELNLRSNTINEFGEKSGKFLFVQISNRPDSTHQEYLLQAKELLSETGIAYINFIQNYIVEGSLLKGGNFVNLSSLSAYNDNIYLFDAPETSLANGGLIFPASNAYLSNTALTTAIDSLIVKSNKSNEQLLSSLQKHERKLGVLRSEPSPVLAQLFNSSITDSMDITAIDKNSVNDVYYKEMSIDNALSESQEQGFLVNPEEMKELLQNYHDLLPYFAGTVTQKEAQVLKRMYKNQVKIINRAYKRNVLSGSSSLSDLFYRKTGIPVQNSRFDQIRINRLTSDATLNAGFNGFYKELTNKLDNLEEMFKKNQLEEVSTPQGICYFIPNHLML